MADNAVAGRRRSILQLGGSALVLAVVFLVLLPKIIDYGDVWAAIKGLTWQQVAVLGALTVLKWITEGAIYAAVLPALSPLQGSITYLSSTAAASVVPGPVDLAVRLGMYRSWGFGSEESTAAVMAGGLFSTFTKLALPATALLLAALARYEQQNLGLYALIGIAVLVVALGLVITAFRSERQAHRIGEAAGRGLSKITGVFRREPVTGMGDRFAGLVRQSSATVRKRWPYAVGASVATTIATVLVLVQSLRFAGVPPEVLPWVPIFAAYATVAFLTVVPITSGNVGVTELVYIGTLGSIAGPEYSAKVAAGIFIYRVFTWILVIPVGWATFGLWQALRKRRGRPVADPHDPELAAEAAELAALPGSDGEP